MKEETKKVINELAYQVYHAGYVDGKEDACENPKFQSTAYQTGLEDAWECARRIVLDEYENSIGGFELYDIFETANCNHILKEYSVSEAMAKIKKYDENKSNQTNNIIEVGDEINFKGELYVVTKSKTNTIECFDKNGNWMSIGINCVSKTGRKFSDIQEILELMREAEENVL